MCSKHVLGCLFWDLNHVEISATISPSLFVCAYTLIQLIEITLGEEVLVIGNVYSMCMQLLSTSFSFTLHLLRHCYNACKMHIIKWPVSV